MVEELSRQLQEKEREYLQLTHDFEEYQDTSKVFQQELESQESQRKTLQSENEDLKDELKKLKVFEK